ncbi:MAG: hypothetical protein ACPIB8_08400, partial [Candidatus Poseidoniaceae archaeon]
TGSHITSCDVKSKTPDVGKKGVDSQQYDQNASSDYTRDNSKISATGEKDILELEESSEQASLNGKNCLHDIPIDNGIENSNKLPMVDIDDQTNIKSNCSGQNISTISGNETEMDKSSMKKDSEMEHGDRSGDYSITNINSNNLSVDVENKELTMEKAGNTVLEIIADREDKTMKVGTIYENTELSSTQENMLLNVLYETTQLGNLFMTELESIQRNGVWNNTISGKLRVILEKYNRSCVKEDKVIRGLQSGETQHRKEILAGECMDNNDLNSDQIEGYSDNASGSDKSCNKESVMVMENSNKEITKQDDETMQRATDLTVIQMTNPNKSFMNDESNVYVRGMEIQSEDMSLNVVLNPGSQLANTNAEEALLTEQTEMAERMDLDQQVSEGYVCYRERNVNDQLGIENSCKCTKSSHGCKSNYDQDRLAVRATVPRSATSGAAASKTIIE